MRQREEEEQKKKRILQIRAVEVIDSRAFPTVYAEVILEGGIQGSAIVPSGASVGKNEALELRDRDKTRWMGKGVLRAVENVNEIIAPALKGKTADVRSIDRAMIELDGMSDKSKLGANAILAVSLANARAIAIADGVPLYELICRLANAERPALPMPMINIISGGLHAGNNLDLQDFLAIPLGAKSFREALECIGKIYHTTRTLLKERGLSTLVADEGGFGPVLRTNEDALKLMSEIVEKANLSSVVAIGIDVASSHFYR